MDRLGISLGIDWDHIGINWDQRGVGRGCTEIMKTHAENTRLRSRMNAELNEDSTCFGAERPSYCIKSGEKVFIVPLSHRRNWNVLRRAAYLPAVLMLLLVASASSQKSSAPAPEKVVAIRAANLIDGVSAQPRHNVLIVIRGNRIESVSEGGSEPTGAARINLGSDVTVLPGLIDTHTHIFLQGEEPSEGGYDAQLLKHPSSYRAARATMSVRRALEQGFTTLRDVETEGAGYGDVGIKEAINK